MLNTEVILQSLKEDKGTWNQTSRIQVRGGFLGYKVKVLLFTKCCSYYEGQSTESQSAAHWKNCYDKGLKCKLF